MRQRTRNTLLAILAVVVVLLALGAVPSLLRSGDPYYLTATATEQSTLDAENHTALNVSSLPESRYPYTSAALADAASNATGRSDPYWKGPFGIKETFTHSPFDELAALQQRNATAVTAEGVYVRANGTFYQVALTQDTDE